MKKTLLFLISLALSPSIFAENLIQVYEQAKETNPDLRSAYANKEKAYSAISGSRASLLPQIGLTASYGITEGIRDKKGINSRSATFYDATLTQSIFDYSIWKTLDITKKQASIYDITYQSQVQSVILNTATNYFNVLKALDAFSYAEANRQEIYRQLEQTRQKHKVGLVAITDVQDAKANYDRTVASKISALNDLNNAIEDLRQVSGRFYAKLASVDTSKFNTKTPSPISSLLKQSESSNLDLITAQLNKEVAKEQISLARAGHLPTLSLTGTANLGRTETYGSSSTQSKSYSGDNYVGVSLNLPIFSGGATLSQVDQAKYNYLSYVEQLESTSRTVVNNVRSAYNNISASISSIQAYQQAAISAQSSLDATKAGYQVGTRTIVDVLTATTNVYSAKQNLSNAKYTYLTNLLQLKYSVGTLTADDLVSLNNMLGVDIDTLVAMDSDEIE